MKLNIVREESVYLHLQDLQLLMVKQWITTGTTERSPGISMLSSIAVTLFEMWYIGKAVREPFL